MSPFLTKIVAGAAVAILLASVGGFANVRFNTYLKTVKAEAYAAGKADTQRDQAQAVTKALTDETKRIAILSKETNSELADIRGKADVQKTKIITQFTDPTATADNASAANALTSELFGQIEAASR